MFSCYGNGPFRVNLFYLHWNVSNVDTRQIPGQKLLNNPKLPGIHAGLNSMQMSKASNGNRTEWIPIDHFRYIKIQHGSEA